MPHFVILLIRTARDYDWNLQVNGLAPQETPKELAKALSGVRFRPGHSPTRSPLQLPRPLPLRLGTYESSVSEVRLRKTVTVPWRNTPYLLDISAIRAWKGDETAAQGHSYWNLQFYGIHWDDAINSMNCQISSTDSQGDPPNMWRREEEDGREKFSDFVQEVFALQSLLLDLR